MLRFSAFEALEVNPTLHATGIAMSAVDPPDVDIVRSDWAPQGTWARLTLELRAGAPCKDYAIVIWELPKKFSGRREDVKTSAQDFLLAQNRLGERHAILFFDLTPGMKIDFEVNSP